MDKAQLAKIMGVCKEINKKHGDGTVYDLGSKKANLPIPRFSSGIEDLDSIFGGGVPKGRIIEIYGEESAGKTSLAYQIASMCEVALYIPIEGTFQSDRAKVFGNRPKQLLVYRADYGEQVMDYTMKFARAGIPLVIIDSVPACIPKDDWEKVQKNNEKDNRMGGVARLFARHLPVLVNLIEVSGTTIILINQTRANVGASLFQPKFVTPGGKAIPFYASIRVAVARRDWIEVPNKNPKNSADQEKVGILQKVKVVKSKVCNPYGEAEIPMFFDRGYESFDDIMKIRKEIMAKNRERYG